VFLHQIFLNLHSKSSDRTSLCPGTYLCSNCIQTLETSFIHFCISMIFRKSKVERVLPCDMIVAGRMHDLTESLKPLIQTHFSGLKPVRFCVMLRTRNNPYLEDKDTIKRDIAALVPPRHIVDLKNPELIILIEVFKVPMRQTIPLSPQRRLHSLV
jgi:hypothetical protein